MTCHVDARNDEPLSDCSCGKLLVELISQRQTLLTILGIQQAMLDALTQEESGQDDLLPAPMGSSRGGRIR